MAWPPPTLSITQANDTPQFDRHPADHASANLAINDLVTKVTGLDTELAGALRTLRTWVPNWVVGGVSVNNASLTWAIWVSVGKLRIGMAAWSSPSGPASPGGFLVGNGFWSASARLAGGFQYFQSGVTNHVGQVIRYDTATATFQVNGQSSVLGVNPPLVPAPGHSFQFHVIALEP